MRNVRLALFASSIALIGLSTDTSQPQPVCGPAEMACAGPFGFQCYRPAAGQTCTLGLVCGRLQSACVGPYGGSCYQPSAGQTCTQGVVCGRGQLACIRYGQVRCYSPAAGQTCG